MISIIKLTVMLFGDSTSSLRSTFYYYRQARQREADLSWVEVTSELELQTRQAALLSLLSSSAGCNGRSIYIFIRNSNNLCPTSCFSSLFFDLDT